MYFLHMWNSCFFCESRQCVLFDGNITCKQPLRLTWRCSSWGWCPSRPPERTPSARSATLAAYCSDTPPVHTADTHTQDEEENHKPYSHLNTKSIWDLWVFYNYNTNTIASFLLTSGRRFCNSSRVSEAQFFLLVPQSGKPTLKNTEDVKKSCMRGSNRSRPISAAGETKGYGCDQRTTTQISEIQHCIIDVDIGKCSWERGWGNSYLLYVYQRWW